MAARAALAETRRGRRVLEVRHRIVDAARALFEEHGFEATRVSAICERADVADKTFFNHFPTKSDVLRAIAADALDDLLEQIETVRKRPGGTRERLRAFFEQPGDFALNPFFVPGTEPVPASVALGHPPDLSGQPGRAHRPLRKLDPVAFGRLVGEVVEQVGDHVEPRALLVVRVGDVPGGPGGVGRGEHGVARPGVVVPSLVGREVHR